MKTIAKMAVVLSAATMLGTTPAHAQTYPGVRFVGDLLPAYDRDGRGVAQVWFDQARNRICASITIGNIQLPAFSTLRTPRGNGGYLIYMPTRISSGCMIQDEYTRIMIATTLSGAYAMKPRVCVYNNEFQPALCGDLRRG